MRQAVVVGLCLVLCISAAAKKKKENTEDAWAFQFDPNYKALDLRFREWLDMVSAIATATERQVFMKLPTVRDRELFIRMFWQQRDPTPGSEVNEYKNEIEERFRYVNQMFGRSSTRPGWATAKGRIYMILGPPRSSENFDQINDLVPAEVWSYSGDPQKGLPSFFNITFFRPHGSGEWELYNPAGNGPDSLLVLSDQMGSANYRQIYEIIKKAAPNLVGPAFSIIPGETQLNFTPSPRNSIILSHILQSAGKDTNPTYAANFLKYKGFVAVESSVNYIDSSHSQTLLKDDRWGYNWIAFSVKPKKLAIGYTPDRSQYFLSFKLAVALKKGEQTVYQYEKKFDHYFPTAELDVFQSGGVVIHDGFPIVPGDFQMGIFLENQVNREFSFFETDVHVPAEAKPRLADPLIGFKTEEQAASHFSIFQSGSARLAVDPDKAFSPGDNPRILLGLYNLDQSLWANGRIDWELQGLDDRQPYLEKGSLRLADRAFARNSNRIETFGSIPRKSDFYRLTLKLVDGRGRVLDNRSADFVVSPTPELARPTEMYSLLQIDSHYAVEFSLGQQLRNLDEKERALIYFENSVRSRPDFSAGWEALLEMRLAAGQFERVLQDIHNLPQQGETAFAFHSLNGRALFGEKRFSEALVELLAANKIFNADVGLINLIGRVYVSLNDREQAVKAFTASLALKKEQPEIQKMLAQLKEPESVNPSNKAP